MNRTFENVLDDCLSQLRAGASVEDCLAQYPEHAADLHPLLAMTAAVLSVPVPRPEPAAFYANRQRMLDAVQIKTARSQSPRFFLFPWTLRGRFSFGGLLNRPLLRAALAMAVLILALSLGTDRLITAAADSLPGDTLYSVKRIAENVQYALTFDSADRHRLQAEFAKERQREVWAILDARRPITVEFQGLLEQMNGSYWVIGGLKVELSDETVIDGQPVTGAVVVVQALSPGDGSLRALRLQVVEADLGPPAPTSSGTVSPTATSTPLAPTATETATLQPSNTPWPSPTAEAVADYTPTPTPGNTQEPKPTELPEPTKTLEPEPTDQPEPTGTEEPEPTATERPKPTATERPEPTRTRKPEPTDTPEPPETEEPEPTETEEPEPTETEEPEPTETEEPEPTETEEPEDSRTPDPEPTEDD
jgi:hypothetical protein